MSKTTKKEQLELLLSLMETHPDIARGFHKGSKEELSRFWRKVEIELNTIGPPVKNITEWKKVWADQKKYVRQKAAQNLKAQKGTGGGPNTQRLLSQFEEGIFNLIGMKESVEGVAVKTFGLCSAPIFLEQSSPTASSSKACAAEDYQTLTEENEIPLKKSPVIKKPFRKQNTKYSPWNTVEEELLVQKELCDTIKTAVRDLKEHYQSSKKLYRSLDRLYELEKAHFKKIEVLKEREVEEMVRHNLSMEKMRLREVEEKIEKNRRMLELEELKCYQN